MKTAYVISDVHIDFYMPQLKTYLEQVPHFEKYFEEHFIPADILFLAGDVANDYYTQIGFLQFLARKYERVYYVFGNHDLLVRGNTTHGNGNPFKTSDDRMARVVSEMGAYPNVSVLEGRQEGPVCGCMGFSDFMYGNQPGMSVFYWEHNFIDSRGWVYKRNRADKISEYYGKTLSHLAELKPMVMMTHYCPVEMGVVERYANDPFTPCFYFTASQYMQGPHPELWICGHTHDQYDTVWTDGTGHSHRIMCNPVGYPNDQNRFKECLAEKKFLIEVDL